MKRPRSRRTGGRDYLIVPRCEELMILAPIVLTGSTEWNPSPARLTEVEQPMLGPMDKISSPISLGRRFLRSTPEVDTLDLNFSESLNRELRALDAQERIEFVMVHPPSILILQHWVGSLNTIA